MLGVWGQILVWGRYWSGADMLGVWGQILVWGRYVRGLGADIGLGQIC